MNTSILLDGENLGVNEFISVVRGYAHVGLSKEAKNKINHSRDIVNKLVEEKKVVYGLTTGFGSLCNISIPSEKTKDLQTNLIRSHASGVGEAFSEEVVRGALLLRANTFAKGHSGVRLELVEKTLEILNKRIYPFIPQQGSVGCSGDLAPLSHLALVVMGEGECIVNKERRPSEEILQQKNLSSLAFSYKEGLAFNNGTPFMTSIAALICYDSLNLVKTSQISIAMSMEALRACSAAIDG